jgi:hypothetical protein
MWLLGRDGLRLREAIKVMAFRGLCNLKSIGQSSKTDVL